MGQAKIRQKAIEAGTARPEDHFRSSYLLSNDCVGDADEAYWFAGTLKHAAAAGITLEVFAHLWTRGCLDEIDEGLGRICSSQSAGALYFMTSSDGPIQAARYAREQLTPKLDLFDGATTADTAPLKEFIPRFGLTLSWRIETSDSGRDLLRFRTEHERLKDFVGRGFTLTDLARAVAAKHHLVFDDVPAELDLELDEGTDAGRRDEDEDFDFDEDDEDDEPFVPPTRNDVLQVVRTLESALADRERARTLVAEVRQDFVSSGMNLALRTKTSGTARLTRAEKETRSAYFKRSAALRTCELAAAAAESKLRGWAEEYSFSEIDDAGRSVLEAFVPRAMELVDLEISSWSGVSARRAQMAVISFCAYDRLVAKDADAPARIPATRFMLPCPEQMIPEQHLPRTVLQDIDGDILLLLPYTARVLAFPSLDFGSEKAKAAAHSAREKAWNAIVAGMMPEIMAFASLGGSLETWVERENSLLDLLGHQENSVFRNHLLAATIATIAHRLGKCEADVPFDFGGRFEGDRMPTYEIRPFVVPDGDPE